MIKSPVFLAVILLLLTLGAVGYQVFELNRLRLENVSAVAEPVQPQQNKQLANGKTIPSFAALASLNLMGNAYRPIEKPVVENLVPISALKLVLIGTIVKENMDESSALIQRSNRETKRYFIGDVIEGGVALASVAIDQVILKREDASEVLRYPQGSFSGTAPTDSPPSVPAPAVVQFPQSAAIAAQAQLQNSQSNNAATSAPQTPPSIGGSRRIMKLRERLKLPTPTPAPMTAPSATDNSSQAAPNETQETN